MAAETEQAKPGFRNVWYLGIVSLFTDISSEMILGVLPLFVTIDLGATEELLGLMEAAADPKLCVPKFCWGNLGSNSKPETFGDSWLCAFHCRQAFFLCHQ